MKHQSSRWEEVLTTEEPAPGAAPAAVKGGRGLASGQGGGFTCCSYPPLQSSPWSRLEPFYLFIFLNSWLNYNRQNYLVWLVFFKALTRVDDQLVSVAPHGSLGTHTETPNTVETAHHGLVLCC